MYIISLTLTMLQNDMDPIQSPASHLQKRYFPKLAQDLPSGQHSFAEIRKDLLFREGYGT